jgi:hypothetical protein
MEIPVSIPVTELLPNTVQAAMAAAARSRVILTPGVAANIAAAVLECADGEHRVRLEVASQLWPQVRKVALKRLHIQMASELVVRKLLPTALPREVVYGSRFEWEPMAVELVVPVRNAPPG